MNIFIIASAAFLNGQYHSAHLEHRPFGSIYQFTTSEQCESKLDEFFKSGMNYDPEKNMNYEFFYQNTEDAYLVLSALRTVA